MPQSLFYLVLFVALSLLGVLWQMQRKQQRLSALLAKQDWQSQSQQPLLDKLQNDNAALQGRAQALQDSLLHSQLQGERQAAELEQHQRLVPALRQELLAATQQVQDVLRDAAELKTRIGQQEASLQATTAKCQEAQNELADWRRRSQSAEAALASVRAENAELQTRLDAEREQAIEKLKLLQQAREQLSDQFRVLANQILEEKSARFAEQNKTSLGSLLEPLRERIAEFQLRVEQTYDKESKERLSLQNEVARLAALNQQISADAVNLTQALKGSNKTQGTWGELVLERVLASSGLRRGEEYVLQAALGNDDGALLRPDVIVHLPEDKHMVIDSKVSLTAYERYASASDEATRVEQLRLHLASVRQQVRNLSEKNYQQLHGLQSLDFVLMFIPVEPAFMLAVAEDDTLFADAFERNVLIVSPSTLLATLRTIASIWRREMQGRNAQEIAQHCGRLYDKFVGFVTDLEEIGKRLDAAQKAYGMAHNKLVAGRGNLIAQAEKVRKLGVKPSRQIRVDLLTDEEDMSLPAASQSECV
ncbi:DNA recombination protein RmuC [Aquitalea pelogenes]|uniref:DNA recombination protein RmuC n=1 Tax=Aquitalea pelogenes TaxID=1293573 RepID=UPI0007874FD1|nr:DNA recombination protein RmuC [Aquitalea pelogenes]